MNKIVCPGGELVHAGNHRHRIAWLVASCTTISELIAREHCVSRRVRILSGADQKGENKNELSVVWKTIYHGDGRIEASIVTAFSAESVAKEFCNEVDNHSAYIEWWIDGINLDPENWDQYKELEDTME